MALIKCKECGKEISDKSKNCIHCGYPIKKELTCLECGNRINKEDNVCKNCGYPIEKKDNKEKKESKNIFAKIWLVLAFIICLLISAINLFNILGLEENSIIINGLYINVMSILSLILAINYGILFKTFNKKWFHLLLGINTIILIYNVLNLQMITHLFYIICAIINVLITFLIIRKKLNTNKFSIKSYLPIFITIIIISILTYLIDYNSYNSDIFISGSNERNENIPQIEVITDYINIREEKDINSNILGKVYYKEIYTIISEDMDSSYNWYEIETSTGIRGFIAGKNNNDDYVEKLLQTQKETEKEEIKETPNNSNNNSNSNNNYIPTPTPTPTPAPEPIPEPAPKSYNITSISGIGSTFKYRDYNECRVDSLTASVKEIVLEGKLQVDYTITMTKLQRFYDNYDSYCHVRLHVYDSSNVVVGSYSAFVDIAVNETGRQSHWIYIDKTGTDYSIRISEDN